MSGFETTTPQPQPAGWYYAEGDPPGTHRYWDGFQWTGGPQPIHAGYAGVPVAPQFVQSAGVGPRAVAFLIDMTLTIIPLVVIVLQPSDVLIAVILGAIVLLWLGNQIVLQGITGQTVGKKLMNLILVDEVTGELPGVLKALGRFLIPAALNSGCGLYWLIDYAWPLFDDRDQRLTDKIFKLTVAPVDRKEGYS